MIVRIANTTDAQLAVSVAGPGDLAADKGLTVALGAGVARKIDSARCVSGICGALWLADREFGAALASAEALRVGYDRAGRPHNADIPMTLFAEAVAAVGKPDVGAPIVATKGELGLNVAEPVDVDRVRTPAGEGKRANPRKARAGASRAASSEDPKALP